jgi:hypothetical protein
MLDMIKLEDNVIIYRSPDKVFAFTTDIKNNPMWQSDILEIEQITDGTDGTFGRGSTYRCVNIFMGQRFETEATVSEYIPAQKCSYQIKAGSINGENSFIYEPVNGGTKFTTLNRLKNILENGG